MRLKLLIFILMLGVFSSCGFKNEKIPKDKKTYYIDKVMAQTFNDLQKKYPVSGCGFGMAAMYEVKKLKLSFQTDQKFSKDELRAMLVDSAHILIQNVRANEGIQPFLLASGFNETNVEIVFYIHDGKNKVYYPDKCIAAFYKGKLEYRTKEKNQESGYFTDERETYEEALAILKEQGRSELLLEECILGSGKGS